MIPDRLENEDVNSYISRCLNDEAVINGYPDVNRRINLVVTKAASTLKGFEAASFLYSFEELGNEEELTVDNLYIPSAAEYIEIEGEQTEEVDLAVAVPGLWDNIRKKKEREGKNYKPAKPGDKDRPDPKQWKKLTKAEDDSEMAKDQLMKMHNQLMEIKDAIDVVEFEEWTKDMVSKAEIYIQNIYDFVKSYKPEEENEDEMEEEEGSYKYIDTKTGEEYYFDRKGIYKKDGRILVPVRAAEYQGRKVTLNKPFRTPDGPKKFSVYTKNDKGNIVKVNFGSPDAGMDIKRDNPERRKSFRARHNCDNPGPKWKAKYWSCKFWSKTSVTKLLD